MFLLLLNCCLFCIAFCLYYSKQTKYLDSTLYDMLLIVTISLLWSWTIFIITVTVSVSLMLHQLLKLLATDYGIVGIKNSVTVTNIIFLGGLRTTRSMQWCIYVKKREKFQRWQPNFKRNFFNNCDFILLHVLNINT